MKFNSAVQKCLIKRGDLNKRKLSRSQHYIFVWNMTFQTSCQLIFFWSTDQFIISSPGPCAWFNFERLSLWRSLHGPDLAYWMITDLWAFLVCRRKWYITNIMLGLFCHCLSFKLLEITLVVTLLHHSIIILSEWLSQQTYVSKQGPTDPLHKLHYSYPIRSTST